MDLDKYRTLFVHEASDYLVQMGQALATLQSEPGSAAANEAVDALFRMAHSIKGMAASLDYESVATLAHAFEDCMVPLRDGGAVEARILALCAEAVAALEEMVEFVESAGTPPDAREELVRRLGDPDAEPSAPASSRTSRAAAPSRSVRVRTDLVDRFLASVGELMQRQARLAALHRKAPIWDGQHAFGEELDLMENVVRDLRRRALDIRTTSVRRITERLPMVVSELARELGKRVRFDPAGDEVEVDRAILDHLDDPLLHVVRNAVDHGLETPAEREAAGKDPVGTLRVDASLVSGRLHVCIEDDGRGIDVESVRRKAIERGLLMEMVAEDLPPERIIEFIFEPGMSTADSVTDISGRGVGMDAVKRAIEALGGTLAVSSRPGLGTRMELDLPSMVALQRVLALGVGGGCVALPMPQLDAVLGADEARIERTAGDAFFMFKDEPLPLLDLGEEIGLPGVGSTSRGNVVVMDVRGFKLGLHVERAIGNIEVYVRDVPRPLDVIPALAGVALLPDGAPVFLLDLPVVVERFL